MVPLVALVSGIARSKDDGDKDVDDALVVVTAGNEDDGATDAEDDKDEDEDVEGWDDRNVETR